MHAHNLDFATAVLVDETLTTGYRKPRQRRADLAARILMCLSDGKPWRRKTLLQEVAPKSGALLHNVLVHLAQRGAIRKVCHGVFISAGSPEPGARDIPDLQSQDASSIRKVLALLAEPRLPAGLQEILGVTRQRVDEILKRLMDRGLARRFRVTGERGLFVYIRADCDEDVLLRRTPELTEARARILSALPPETSCRATDVGALTQLDPYSFQYLNQLGAMGLVVNVKLGPRRYVRITAKGLQHPQYDANAPKAAAADIIKDFRAVRARFIQMLDVLGSARTIDLTFTLPSGYFDGKSETSGPVIHRLQKSGLVEVSTSHRKDKHPTYRLTEKGRQVAAVLSGVRQPIPADALREIIAVRRRDHRERLRFTRMEQTRSGAVSMLTVD